LEQFVNDSDSDEGSFSGSEESKEEREFDSKLFDKDIGETLEQYQEIKFTKNKSQNPATQNEFIPLDEI